MMNALLGFLWIQKQQKDKQDKHIVCLFLATQIDVHTKGLITDLRTFIKCK